MAFSRVLAVSGVLAVGLGSCGGTTNKSAADAVAGSASQGASSSGGTSAGAAHDGSAAGGASGRGNVGGTEAGRTSEGGAADTNVAGSGLAGGGHAPSDLSCDSPYAGPIGGPRVDGPIAVDCTTITDQQILARYKDADARVPKGLYYEPTQPLVRWNGACSPSLAKTVESSASEQLGTFAGQYTTNWFYEAEYCDVDLRYVYRNLRCDYFDDAKLIEHDPDKLAFLASILWWRDNSNLEGSQLLGYSVSVGNATDWVDLCSFTTVYGDFGLCDEIVLQTTTDSIHYDGEVTFGVPKTVRMIKGDCH